MRTSEQYDQYFQHRYRDRSAAFSNGVSSAFCRVIMAGAVSARHRRVLIDQNLKYFDAHNATTAIAVLEADPKARVIANTACALRHPRLEKLIALSFNSPGVRLPGEGDRLSRAIGTLQAMRYNNNYLVKTLEPLAARPENQLWIWRDGDPRNAYAALDSRPAPLQELEHHSLFPQSP